MQAAGWSAMMNGLATWYTEQLPIAGRGPLMASVSFGWPIGRFAAQLAVSCGASWRVLMKLSSALLAVCAVRWSTAHESPRYLARSGDHLGTKAALGHMFAQNGNLFEPGAVDNAPPPAEVVAAAGVASVAARARLLLLHRPNRVSMLFALGLYAVLSMTTVLIDTWGPRTFSAILYPTPSVDTAEQAAKPPAPALSMLVLMLFNAGDGIGIACSIVGIDRIGRKGAFAIGFVVQAVLWLAFAALAAVCGPTEQETCIGLLLLGFAASATRCFGWEAAQMWTLEVFPTNIRASAFASTQGVMRIFSMITVSATAEVLSKTAPGTCLVWFALLLLPGGLLGFKLPKETANLAMAEQGI